MWNRVGEKKFWQENLVFFSPISFTHIELRSKIAYVFCDETKIYFHSTSHKNSVVFFYFFFTGGPANLFFLPVFKSWTRKKSKQIRFTKLITENKLLSSSVTSRSHPCCVWPRPDWCSPAADPLWADGPWRCWWAAWSAASSSSAGLETQTDKSIQLHAVKCINTI